MKTQIKLHSGQLYQPLNMIVFPGHEKVDLVIQKILSSLHILR